MKKEIDFKGWRKALKELNQDDLTSLEIMFDLVRSNNELYRIIPIEFFYMLKLAHVIALDKELKSNIDLIEGGQGEK